MLPQDYQNLAQRTECDQSKSRERMMGYPQDLPHYTALREIRLNHSIIGLAGEVGELASQFQKMV